MILIFDCEVTITPPKGWTEGQSLLKGGNPSPYVPTNRLVSIHYKELGTQHKDCLWMDRDTTFQRLLNAATLLIGFNIKFDLSWIRECGFKYDGEIYDCQLAEYIQAGGQVIQPSLNEVAESYGLPKKKDKVEELWNAGINTDEIDKDILKEYGDWDVYLTEQIYLKQQERIK